MSPLVITLLIVGGIALLIAIAYVNHMVENNKLEKARFKTELNDRIRRCATVSESLPGQLMTPQLKLMLSHLQMHFTQRLVQLQPSDADSKAQLETLRQLIAQGDAIPVQNPPQQISSEAKAKEVRFQLENLHGQITRCTQDGILPAKEAKHWVNEVRHMLVQLHIELFGNLGQLALQQSQPGQARLAFERGVQYLRKQTDTARYQALLQRFEAQLARANAMVVDMGKPTAEDASELTEGLKSLEGDEDWKKKNIYD
ncbi:hypothetical protein P8H27_03260 [Pseudomonas sp. sp1636]|uniref:hypothetical protein n=1 Tax=Pseudomonas sp. sp1636 TaxID=3036707 RepID=UPI0025A5DB5E|nr:hypothetical protein [Pseudomonas sp. sp1636]MDM8347915.1 hypothetical protein [Pseudomonas sp. sp1636]